MTNSRQNVLMEALPYIRKFHKKTIVIKLGGHAMVDHNIMNTVVEDAVLLHYVGMRVVLVHGGGPEITEKMKMVGKEPKFVGGLRVTDEDTLEIAQMVLAGKISNMIVSMIAKNGAKGVGISGNDGGLVIAEKTGLKKVQVGDKEIEVDLGLVGDIREINPQLLETMLDAGYIPVVSPLALDKKGNDLNINADTMAGELAVALKAYKLISLTDVDGVMNKDRTELYHRLTLKNIDALMADGTISGGMIPKIQASVNAVRHGVEGAHILNGNAEHNLLLELFTDFGVGTMITASMISL
ncbi:MAG TPA: acetylglutamate kinase [Methanocorpusculum sp.]|jgi:acetylglutamate kinase|nr:acetylglutamate kinase [Methanocorpusculum sp.]MBR5008214.1 acetylglutamate kinase [Methanocorpusculum sp.]MEE1135914.1 acetylglutamate kinase [Methanocorpusculum sp.]HJJ61488.1 acetylglutamate kinase [Methanocorpusculum sp.]HJJ62311.1 acetylglutamate kinase [Methanocorpusculum sp.]